MHKGEVGTQALNGLLQERLNPWARRSYGEKTVSAWRQGLADPQ